MTESAFERVWRDLLSLVWPAACLGCGRADRDWCAACQRAFQASHGVHDVVPPVGAHGVWRVSGVYEGMRRELIVRVKHRGQLGLARHLGRALHEPLLSLGAGVADPPLIVPIPSRRARVRARGYRHLELVLRHSGVPGWRSGARILAPGHGRTGQVGLDERERHDNAAKLRLNLRAHVAGRDVILVDDVITTGATLTAADRLLTAHGARVVGAAAIAATPRLDRPKS